MTLPSLAGMIWVFVRFDGRIGREVYWLANILLVAVLILLVKPYIVVTEDEISIQGGVMPIAAMLIAGVSSLAVAAKRLHDLGLNGLLAVLLVVPVVSLVAMVVLGVIKGSDAPNAYGPAPDRPPPDRQA